MVTRLKTIAAIPVFLLALVAYTAMIAAFGISAGIDDRVAR